MDTKNRTIFNTLFIYLITAVGFMTLRLLRVNTTSVGITILNVFIQIVLIFALPVFLFPVLQRQKMKNTFKFFGYKKISAKAVVITIALGFFLFIVNGICAGVFDLVLKGVGYKSMAITSEGMPVSQFLLSMVVTAVLPGICEETSHRGMLLKGFTPLGSKAALLLSALLFGLMHMNIEQFFYCAISGWIMGYVALLCDSIVPSMIIHFMNNGLNTLVTFSASHNGLFGKMYVAAENYMSSGWKGYIFTALLLALVALIVSFLIKKLFVETTAKNMVNVQTELYREVARKDYLSDVARSKAEVAGKEVKESSFDLEEIYLDKNIKLGYMTDLDRDLLADTGKFKLSAINIILFIACFAVTGGMTILSFVRGVI